MVSFLRKQTRGGKSGGDTGPLPRQGGFPDGVGEKPGGKVSTEAKLAKLRKVFVAVFRTPNA
jgi:hypothetical protein